MLRCSGRARAPAAAVPTPTVRSKIPCADEAGADEAGAADAAERIDVDSAVRKDA